MTYLLRITLAVLLGSVAAVSNWFYMSIQSTPGQYVAASGKISVGAAIDEEDLVPVPVPGDVTELRRSLIPYASRSILLGRKANREYLQGDVVFSRDMVTDRAANEWDVIGPFELISVGERFKQTSGREQSPTGSTRGDTVTIAVDADFDVQTSRLLSVIAEENGGQKGGGAPVKIVAVQVVPSQQSELRNSMDGQSGIRATGQAGAFDARSFLDAGSKNYVYQTVSLQGIANVPGVLLEGDFIRFVVPNDAF